MKLGEGLWQSVSGKGTFRRDYLDTAEAGRRRACRIARRRTVPVLYSVVLHLKDRKIGGIETLVQRITPDSRFQPTELGRPGPGHERSGAGGEGRQSRATMIATALTYPAGTEGRQFHRWRHALRARGLPGRERGDPCRRGLWARAIAASMRSASSSTRTSSRSVAAVDDENGVVLLWMNFGDTGSYGPGKALVAFEIVQGVGRPDPRDQRVLRLTAVLDRALLALVRPAALTGTMPAS